MINVRCACRTEEAMDFFAYVLSAKVSLKPNSECLSLTTCAFVRADLRAPFHNLQILSRDNVIARMWPSAELLACIAKTQYMLELLFTPHLPLTASAVTAPFPDASKTNWFLRRWTKQHAIFDVNDETVLKQRMRFPREVRMYWVTEQIVVEFFLRCEFKNEAVRHALTEWLPGVVLAHAQAQHVRLAGVGVKTWPLQRLEGVKVVLEFRPADVGSISEENDMSYWRTPPKGHHQNCNQSE